MARIIGQRIEWTDIELGQIISIHYVDEIPNGVSGEVVEFDAATGDVVLWDRGDEHHERVGDGDHIEVH